MYTAFLDGILITVQISAFFFLMTKAGNSLKWDLKISMGSFPVPKHFLALNRLDRNNLKKKTLVKAKEYYDTQGRKAK